jgi:hypothetical protein
VVRAFSTSTSFVWTPMQEGTYDIQVTVTDGFGASIGESATVPYTATSRVTGTSAVVSPTSNPLVALYSAPPSPGSSMYVQFSPAGPDPSWRSTAPQPVVPGESTSFLVAGLLPNTAYLMRHVLSDGTPSDPLTFTTGSLPANLTFPAFTVQQAPAPGTDLTQDMVYHVGINTAPGAVDLLTTDLSGNVNWYYDPVANNFYGYGPTLVPGGTVLMLGGSTGVFGNGSAGTLREIDLAGDPLRETNIQAVNAQLAALGKDPIINFNHDAQRLPNGDTAVIAGTQRTIVVNGTPTLYTADDVIVLDQNFQVAWVWDSLDWLDPTRLPTNGEGPGDFTHANSVAWSPADGNLVVSLRAQDWVVKIDYAHGTGDGHVVWRLGQGGDFAINSSDPSPWFSHQHDARFINDNTLVLFDNGNTRRLTNPNADSRGQELVVDEQAMTATLVANADLGNYSAALGSAQVLPNGNLDFTSGLLGSFPFIGQSIEVSPGGIADYVLQMNSLEYRSYFMSTLYETVTSSVSPLPAVTATPQFTVSWSGRDGAGGSGIASYSIYVSVDGGAFLPWLTNTTLTSATYDGAFGHSYAFYSVATDSAGNVQPTPTAAQASTELGTPPTITSANAATLTVGTAGSFTITTNPGVPVALTLGETGPLPAGLTFTDNHNGTATLAGTATAGGLFTVTITAANGVAPNASQTFQLTVNPPVIALTPALASAQVGVAYRQGITASGGTAPYHGFVVTSGALPAGLTLNASSGQLSGTPTAGGTFHFTVQATDSSTGTGPFAGNQPYTLAVAAPGLMISPSLPGPAKVGQAFSQAISAGGGTGPYRYSISSGSLPPGVALNAQTGALSGTPRAPGAYHFAVRVTDSSTGTGPYSTSRSLTLSVAQGAVARLVSLSRPGNAAVNGWLAPFQVLALDLYGNRLSGIVVRLELVPLLHPGPTGFRPGSVLQATTANGVATFSHVAIAGLGRYELLAAAGAVGAYSDPFSVGFEGLRLGRSS